MEKNHKICLYQRFDAPLPSNTPPKYHLIYSNGTAEDIKKNGERFFFIGMDREWKYEGWIDGDLKTYDTRELFRLASDYSCAGVFFPDIPVFPNGQHTSPWQEPKPQEPVPSISGLLKIPLADLQALLNEAWKQQNRFEEMAFIMAGKGPVTDERMLAEDVLRLLTHGIHRDTMGELPSRVQAVIAYCRQVTERPQPRETTRVDAPRLNEDFYRILKARHKAASRQWVIAMLEPPMSPHRADQDIPERWKPAVLIPETTERCRSVTDPFVGYGLTPEQQRKNADFVVEAFEDIAYLTKMIDQIYGFG